MFRVVFHLYSDTFDSPEDVQKLDRKFPRMAAETDDAWRSLIEGLKRRGEDSFADQIEPRRGIGPFFKILVHLALPCRRPR